MPMHGWVFDGNPDGKLTIMGIMMKILLMSAPIDMIHQPRVLTDDEIDEISGGVTAIKYGFTTNIGAVNERLAVGKGMIDVAV